MNDLDFLALVEFVRKGLLFLFNSSLFWLFTSLYLTVGTINAFKRSASCSYVSRVTKSKKSWCYDE